MNLAIARLANIIKSNKVVKKQRLGGEVLLERRWFCSKEVVAGDDKPAVVDEDGGESNVTPIAKRRNGKNLIWDIINRDTDFVPALYEYFPSGLGDAMIQATNNFNKLFETKPVLKCIGPVKELEDCYKMRYVGIGKENAKITVKDGVLRVNEDGNEKGWDDEKWGWSFGCYERTLVLTKDAKADEIKVEVKDGVLNVVVPKIGIPKRDIKEIPSS